MRENMGLYRGKRKDNGEWIEGAYSPYNWDIFGEREEKPQIIIISDDENIDGLWCEVIPETVGQYTGLTDKNGVRIFEGDIVKHYNTVYEISYITKYTRFAGRNGSCIFAGIPLENTEVIGNIHDNPELLQKF